MNLSEIKILVVDDEADIRNLIQGILEDEGYETIAAADAQQALEKIDTQKPNLIVQDIWLQNSDKDGVDILKITKKKYPEIPVIMISGHGTIETAVSSIKLGAYDFIEKPFKSDRLILMIKRAIEAAELKKENVSLKEIAGQKTDCELIGKSNAIQSVRHLIDRVASTNSRILITGEPGTGKEIAARMIHRMSQRKNKPMIIVNCATMHPDHMEEELFGVENSKDIREGLLEKANGGTLLFDEISDMPLTMQGKIVRLLQEQTFTRLRGTHPIQVDIRFLASSNRNLEDLIKREKFRKDLYYRLNVVPMQMPCLKDRLQDIPDLIKSFAKDIERQSGLLPKTFTPKLISALQSYDWPGNVRQLRNSIEWMMIMCGPDNDKVCIDYLPPNLGDQTKSQANQNSKTSIQIMPEIMSKSLREAREDFERHYLLSQIKKFDGNISKTAKFVGMERSALHRKLKMLQVDSSSDDSDNEEQISQRQVV